MLRPLALTEGATVVDLGTGAGYFALKLSALVGAHGVVLGEDVRLESLASPWIRASLETHATCAVSAAGAHGTSSEVVGQQIGQHGFETIGFEEPFIDRPEDDDAWWIIVARKP